MQELIDDLKELKKDSKERNQDTSFDIGMTFAIARAELRLEKEKEQIIDAYENGVGDENERNLSGHFTSAEQYYNQTYNQTYNQDRITISETKRSIEGIGLNNQNK